MKKRCIATLLIASLAMGMLTGCGNKDVNSAEDVNTEYIENLTEAEDVEVTESTEIVESTEVAEVVEDVEATERTETKEDAEVEVLYTYTNMSVVKYAQQAVNVRNLPSTDGEQIGSLTTNQEVVVTGQCNETGWYMIEYNGGVGFVSNNYLGDTVVEVQQTVTSNPAVDELCPYALYTIFYDATGLPYFYGSYGGSANMDPTHYTWTESCMWQMDEYVRNNFRVVNPDGSWTEAHSTSWKLIGTYCGVKIVVRYIDNLNGIPMGAPELRGIPVAGNGIF